MPMTSDLCCNPSVLAPEIVWARSVIPFLFTFLGIHRTNTFSSMAYHEMRLILAKVLYNFDLELCADSKDWLEQSIFILWDKTPLMVKLKTATNS